VLLSSNVPAVLDILIVRGRMRRRVFIGYDVVCIAGKRKH
jgi:hypothetical protein